MKKHLFAAALLLAIMPSVKGADSDPVLMTVDGHDVRVSEFEYLYNKNNSQQANPQSLDEYLQMFIDYKLKVADAEHHGLQKSPDFVTEFTKYRSELAAPYLRSQEREDALVAEAYRHRLNDVYVSHIMVPLENDGEHMLDCIRTDILAGKTTFEAEARKHSVDRGSSAAGGRMGYVIPDRFPWAFEKMAYDTPEGQISPVVNSGFGYHIIRVESVRPASGLVEASHILRVTRGKSPEEVVAQEALADSLYNVLMGGADFADLATRYSEDPGSARNGGALGFFPRGAMVAEFDSVSFALPDGAVSRPFKTSFGYHIVKRTGHKGIAPLDELRGSILEAMKRDGRSLEPQTARIEELREEYKASPDSGMMTRVREMILANGGYDSVVVAKLSVMKDVAGRYTGGTVSVADVMASMPEGLASDPDIAADAFDQTVQRCLTEGVLDSFRSKLMSENADYRNLVNEYRDGILLYEISNRNVWDRASKDREGLEAFFKANLNKYKWEQPKFKSYVIFATSDSVLNEAVKYADGLSTADPAKFVQDMRTRFGRDIKIERVIAAKGENKITDYLGFGAEKPADNGTKWVAYAAYKGRVIDQPEESADVRGAAVTDYQAKLDADWVAGLRKAYKVKVKDKVFKALKQKAESEKQQ